MAHEVDDTNARKRELKMENGKPVAEHDEDDEDDEENATRASGRREDGR